MASSASSGKTAPKGRATRRRGARQSSSRIGPTMQWTLVILLGLAIVGVVLYIGRDVRSTVGAPAAVVVDVETISGA